MLPERWAAAPGLCSVLSRVSQARSTAHACVLPCGALPLTTMLRSQWHHVSYNPIHSLHSPPQEGLEYEHLAGGLRRAVQADPQVGGRAGLGQVDGSLAPHISQRLRLRYRVDRMKGSAEQGLIGHCQLLPPPICRFVS